MYYLISGATAALIAAMVLVNGALSTAYDPYTATVIIHTVGFVPVCCIAAARREPVFAVRGIRPVHFLGGAIGVATVICNNAAYGGISVSAIVALSLLGQTVCALLIDQLGLFGMPVRRCKGAQLIGVACTVAGIACMLSGAAWAPLPVLFAFLMGVTNVLSRSVNAQLAERTTTFVSTWYNYAVGLSVAIIAWVAFYLSGAAHVPAAADARPWIYLGGLMGICSVTVLNVVTKRMPAFRLTLLLFAVQVFTGLIIDALSGAGGDGRQWIGGAFAVVGLSLNMLLERRAAKHKTA